MQGINKPVLYLVKSIVVSGVNRTTYRQRALILEQMFAHETLKSGAHQINAECNVSQLVTATMKDVETLSFTSLCSSSSCRCFETRNLSLVPVNMKTFGLHPAECHQSTPNHSEAYSSSSDVPRCDGVVTHSYDTGEALFVELGTEQNFVLSDFPVNITLKKESFTLRGICGFSSGPNQKSSWSLCCFLQEVILSMGAV